VVETDDCPEDTVIDVIQKGYGFGGVMLRPAMVRVSCSVKR
jgi:molecular chaperone GrpE (heat shock protein)